MFLIYVTLTQLFSVMIDVLLGWKYRTDKFDAWMQRNKKRRKWADLISPYPSMLPPEFSEVRSFGGRPLVLNGACSPLKPALHVLVLKRLSFFCFVFFYLFCLFVRLSCSFFHLSCLLLHISFVTAFIFRVSSFSLATSSKIFLICCRKSSGYFSCSSSAKRAANFCFSLVFILVLLPHHRHHHLLLRCSTRWIGSRPIAVRQHLLRLSENAHLEGKTFVIARPAEEEALDEYQCRATCLWCCNPQWV